MVLKQKNRNLIIGLAIALGIALLVILFLLVNRKNSNYQKVDHDQNLNNKNYENEKLLDVPIQEKVPSLVLFYANWCGHSQNFLDVWKRLLQENLKCDMIGLEQEKNPEDIEVNSISGFPTVRLYPNGYIPSSKEYIEYNGNRSLQSLVDFVQSGGNSAL